MSNLKILTGNVKGLADVIKRKQLYNFLHKGNYDITFLQETHSTAKSQKIWRNQYGSNIIFSHGESNARGVAILFSKQLEYKLLWSTSDEKGRYIVCKVKIDESTFLLCNCYAPNEDNPGFFKNLIKIIQEESNNVDFCVWGGDFNKTLTPNDKLGDFSLSKSSTLLNSFLEEENWSDIWRYTNPERMQYTWFQRRPIRASRIDYFLVHDSLIDLVSNCEIVSGKNSDHSFVVLELRLIKSLRGPGSWKLNNTFLNEKEYLDEVNSIIMDIKTVSTQDASLKWDIMKNNVINFSKDYGKSKAKIRKDKTLELERKIQTQSKKLAMINLGAQNAISLISKINDKLDTLKSELDRIEKIKVQGQMLRSRVKWSELAERNTKYFFGLEKFRSKAKVMNKIIVNDRIITDPSLVLHEQFNFYSNLYTVDRSINFDLNNNTEKKLNETQKILLDSDISTEELAEAVKSMPRNKVPGLDGLPSEFYQVFFLQLKELMLAAFQQAKKNKVLHLSARFGVLSLIPKKFKNRTNLGSWRPISLLPCDYKVLSKVFANRIKLTLDTLIDEDQSGFIKGRDISANVRSVLDLLSYTKDKNIEALLILVDMEKAFDRVDYKALYNILRFFNVGENFIAWIKILFEEINLTATNNGHFSSYWKPTRGLFQGNPIASFLFLFVVEILALKLKENPKIKGIERKGIKHLISLFADDISLFLQFKQETWSEVMKTFDIFEKMTGMRISYEKTTIYRIGSLANSKAKFYSTRKVKWVTEPVNVLGVTVCNNETETLKLNYDPLISKVKGILDTWSVRGLTLVGKVQIINSLITSLFIYKCSVLPLIPPNYLKAFKTMILDFLWSGKKAKIAYKTLILPKQEGGLGLSDIETRDKAMKANWVFKVNKNAKHCSLVDEVIGNPIGVEFWSSQMINKDITKVFAKIPKFWFQVISLWFEIEFDDPLEGHQVRKQMIWFNSNVCPHKRPHWKQNLYSKGLKHLSDLLHEDNSFLSFQEFSTKFSTKDFLYYNALIKSIPPIWIDYLRQDDTDLSFKDKYIEWGSVKRTAACIYNHLISNQHQIYPKYLKWKRILGEEFTNEFEDFPRLINRMYVMTNSTKLRSFHFRILHHAIITNIHLKRYGIKDSENCSLCQALPETVEHLFYECEKVKPLWTYVKVSFQLQHHSCVNILLNTVNDNPRLIGNCIVLLTKHFIYSNRCTGSEISVHKLKIAIERFKETEYYIAINKNKLGQHLLKWN